MKIYKIGHSCFVLEEGSTKVMTDPGSTTAEQVKIKDLDAVLITHIHGDHVFGLPGILNTLRLNGYNRKLEIYGPKGSKEWIRKYLDLVGGRGQDLDLRVVEVKEGIIFDEGEYFVETKEMDHDCPCVGYSFVVKSKSRLDVQKLKKLNIPNSPLIGKLAEGKVVTIDGKKIDGKKLLYKEEGRKVSFIVDTRVCDNTVKLAKGADLLIAESTFSKKEDAELLKNRAHLSSIEAAGIAKKAKVKALALIHLSQRYEGIPKVILKEAKEVFKNTIVREDLDRVEL